MSARAKTKNDKAWEKIFDKFDILRSIHDNGLYQISATEINEFREARLMTKFDQSFQLPYMFTESELSILPVSRGEYIISEINTFANFDHSSDLIINDFESPIQWESLDYKNVTSEAGAINCAYVGGLLQDFLNEDVLFPTVNGRMSSSEFDFKVAKSKADSLLNVSVRNSQIEIDGGYEGLDAFSLIEAKNTLAPDFLIRQLYYPYRLWTKKIGKPVRNVFLTYSNGIYHFREYEFIDINHYNSLRLIQEKKYRFKEKEEDEINIEILQHYIFILALVEEPKIPFPQANSFERVINFCEVINSSEDRGVTSDDLLSNFYFTEQESLTLRQVDYYYNAAAYLGFVEKEIRDGVINYVLTNRGASLFDLSILERQREFVKSILSHKVFKKVLNEYLTTASRPSIERIVSFMKESNLYNINSEETYFRRASTISAWIDWIMSQIE